MNDFSNDSSNLALWRFEAAALLQDAKGTNDYTAYGNPAAELTDYREGSACLRLDRSQSQYLAIADNLLDEGFPLKLGDQRKLLVFCLWLKTFSSLEQVLLCKSDGSSQSLLVGLKDNGLWIEWGYNTGLSQEVYPTYLRVAPQQWHHLFLAVDGLKRQLHLWLYQAWTRSWQVCSYQPRNELWVGAGTWYLGAAPDGRCFDGLLDEAAVFNAVKSAADRCLIIQGLFGAANLTSPLTAVPLTPAGWRWNQSYWR